MPDLRLLRSFLFCLCAAVATRAQDPVRWHGLELDLPKGWSTQAQGEILLLLPAGWRAGEETGEAYGLLFDEATKDLADPDLADTIDGAADAIVTGVQRQGDGVAGKLGALDARTFRYTTQNARREPVTLTIHVVVGAGGASALFALGLDQKLAGRAQELAALRDSLRLEGQKAKKRAFGLGGRSAEQPAGDATPAVATDPAAAPAPAAPKFRRIEGADELVWRGVAIDVPKGWRTQAGEDGTQLLLPPGFGESGVLEEIYALCGDGSLQSLDGPDTLAKVQAAIDEVQPGLRPQGDAKAAKFGALAGKAFVFRGENELGQQVEARVHAFPMQGGIGALLSLGLPKSLQGRAATVASMLDSLRPAAGAAAGKGGIAAELAGQWVYYSSVNANNGGGSSSQRVLSLRGDGTYTFGAESVSTNPNGAAWGDQNDAGRWSVDGGRITFRSNGGPVRTCSLEKRNHPKNRDPMLVIDGDAFVTATQRSPW